MQGSNGRTVEPVRATSYEQRSRADRPLAGNGALPGEGDDLKESRQRRLYGKS
jgi:hypothetical protein